MRESPSEEFLARLARCVGLQSLDLFLVADLTLPDDALSFDAAASRELPELVRLSLSSPPSIRQRMLDYARSLAEMPRTIGSGRGVSFEQYPPGFGSLLVRMLALRNLGWSSAAKVMYLMSGVYVSAATIGAVGRGVKELDAELAEGFAAVLGIPASILAALTGANYGAEGSRRPAEMVETAALLWEVRHLSAAQVKQVCLLSR